MTAEAEYLQALTTSKLSSARRRRRHARTSAASMAMAAKRKLELLGMEDADIGAIKAPDPDRLDARADQRHGGRRTRRCAARRSIPATCCTTLGTLDRRLDHRRHLRRRSRARARRPGTRSGDDRLSRRSLQGRRSRASVPNVDPTTHTAADSLRGAKSRAASSNRRCSRGCEIVTSAGDALVVPQDALVFDTDAYYAFVDVGGGRLERRKVAIASWNGKGFARVVSGLTAGERVVAARIASGQCAVA